MWSLLKLHLLFTCYSMWSDDWRYTFSVSVSHICMIIYGYSHGCPLGQATRKNRFLIYIKLYLKLRCISVNKMEENNGKDSYHICGPIRGPELVKRGSCLCDCRWLSGRPFWNWTLHSRAGSASCTREDFPKRFATIWAPGSRTRTGKTGLDAGAGKIVMV